MICHLFVHNKQHAQRTHWTTPPRLGDKVWVENVLPAPQAAHSKPESTAQFFSGNLRVIDVIWPPGDTIHIYLASLL